MDCWSLWLWVTLIEPLGWNQAVVWIKSELVELVVVVIGIVREGGCGGGVVLVKGDHGCWEARCDCTCPLPFLCCHAILGSCSAIYSSFSSFIPRQPSFDQILQEASLPEPGPEYYAARRRIWLTPTRVLPPPPPASSSRQRIENLFNQSNGNSIVYSSEAWRNGLEKAWKGLSSGVRLKYKLPLNIVVSPFIESLKNLSFIPNRSK